MDSDIWRDCQGPEHIAPLKTSAIRLVESQEQIATTALVDTLEEQRVLEELLDATKPPAPHGTQSYHYLIWTPFRYPPLPYGSRFGNRSHHGIFYASVTLETALAECAYYRLVFLTGLSEPLPVERLTTEHISFEVQIDTNRGVDLASAPFARHAEAIRNPKQYDATQALGTAMREAAVEAFTYPSARDPRMGINLGVLQLQAIKSRKPRSMRQWICTTTRDKVAFIGAHMKGEHPHSFSYEEFMVGTDLPVPAC